MRSIRQGALLAAVTVMTAVVTPVAAAAAPGSCQAPPRSSPGYNDFVLTYKSECATKKNYDRTFPDVTASVLVDKRNKLAVTASTALAGAIASVKVNDKEFISSGGHGAAFQYAFHAWQKGEAATECYNPTQAGTRMDDVGQPPPYHGPSTSALYTMAKSGGSIRTAVRPAMFVTLADKKPGWGDCLSADHQDKRVPFTMGLSPYWLETEIDLAPDHDAPALENVFRAAATITSDDERHDHFSGVLVAYLQPDFTKVFSYSPATGRLSPKPVDSHTSKDPMVRCTGDGAYCLGMYVKPDVLGDKAYYYTMTRPPMDYNGHFGENTIQVTSPSGALDKGDKVDYETYVVVGDKSRVEQTMTRLHRTFS
ncbi:hypothetical protein SAMN05444920_13365 [Nonomuraea solani]|uniref:Uncharacterized protein n=1 Tax=Nonomuraea solani TaxID=1144553 RepID=A0A1H6F1C1_9ACTN|nr:hypothetical protein [Nonomuraea solani]SEH03161.1 hypothetical protein SAMN05444920_13365 [Nonomuraea solani]